MKGTHESRCPHCGGRLYTRHTAQHTSKCARASDREREHWRRTRTWPYDFGDVAPADVMDETHRC